MAKIYTERRIIHPEKNVDLEVIMYFSEKGTPNIFFAPGLGGHAEESSSTRNLTSKLDKDYAIVIFSPRGIMGSTRDLTIQNYVSDANLVIEDISQRAGKRPYGLGHSLGGYALARVLGVKDSLEKAVLLAPELRITEEIPKIINELLNTELGRGLCANFLETALYPQRFTSHTSKLNFLESLYNVPPCTRKINIPTYIILCQRTSFGFKIKTPNEIRKAWQNLQSKDSKIETCKLNHYFTESILPDGKNFFKSSEETEKILKEIHDFIRGS